MIALGELLPADTRGVVRRAFGLMGVAEEEIAAACRGKPARVRKRLNATFGELNPGMLSEYENDGLYRAHVRELLERARLGEDMRPGTDAECLAVLLRASLDAPPNRDHAALAFELFAKVFPGQKHVAPEDGSEMYAGAMEEIRQRLRKKLARDRRCKRAGKP